MATTKLIIRNYKKCLNKDGTTLIFLQYCHGYKMILLSTGERISPEYFDSKRQEVKRSYKGFSSINMIIKSFQEKIDNISRDAKLHGAEPTVEYVKESLKAKAKKIIPTFFEFIETYIEEHKVLKQPITIRSYKTSFRQLKEYSDHIGKKVNYEDLTLAFYDSFRQHKGAKNKKESENNSLSMMVENSNEKSNQFPPLVGFSDTKNDKTDDPSKLDVGKQHDGRVLESVRHIEPKPEKKRIRDMTNLEAFALLENDLLLIMAFFAFLCRIGHVTAKLMEREDRENGG